MWGDTGALAGSQHLGYILHQEVPTKPIPVEVNKEGEILKSRPLSQRMWEGAAWMTCQCEGFTLISLHRAGSNYLPSFSSPAHLRQSWNYCEAVQPKGSRAVLV